VRPRSRWTDRGCDDGDSKSSCRRHPQLLHRSCWIAPSWMSFPSSREASRGLATSDNRTRQRNNSELSLGRRGMRRVST
jgi:hypothetical protein